MKRFRNFVYFMLLTDMVAAGLLTSIDNLLIKFGLAIYIAVTCLSVLIYMQKSEKRNL